VSGIAASNVLRSFADRSLNVIASGAFEGVQFTAAPFRFYSEKPHFRSAFGALGPLNCIRMRRGWLIGDHLRPYFRAKTLRPLERRVEPQNT
jgi:hypothetical protein